MYIEKKSIYGLILIPYKDGKKGDFMNKVNIVFNERNFNLFEGTKETISQKLEKLTNIVHITKAELFFNKDQNEQNILEARVHIKNKDLFAKTKSDNVKKGINSLFKKIEKQIKKEHDILIKSH